MKYNSYNYEVRFNPWSGEPRIIEHTKREMLIDNALICGMHLHVTFYFKYGFREVMWNCSNCGACLDVFDIPGIGNDFNLISLSQKPEFKKPQLTHCLHCKKKFEDGLNNEQHTEITNTQTE